MSIESQLREKKLRQIEALFTGAGTAGERLAAEGPLERMWPESSELDQALQAHLHQETLRLIRDGVFPTQARRWRFRKRYRPTRRPIP
jgi:hypothetical protein